MGVAVVADTTHYLPPEIVEARGIHLVSLYVNWVEGQTRESELMSRTDYFYEHLRSATEMPTTSQPSIGDFLAVYEPLLAQGHEIVSVHLSGGISGTVESARQAAEQAGPDRITVVDSETAAGGYGIVVLAAAIAAQGGGSRDEVVERARLARSELKMWFCVDTLEFLRRGGRIGGAQAWLGSALKIKPILTFEQEIKPVERVRTARRAQERMIDYLRTRKDEGADAWVVQHIQAPEVAEKLVAAGREMYGVDPVFVSEIGPVLGTHAGPGLIGVGGIPSKILA